MAKISTYTNAGTPTLDDKLIGTEIGATPTDATKNFTVQQLLGVIFPEIEKGVWASLPEYPDNTAAVAAGLEAGRLFVSDGTGALAKGLVGRRF